GAKLGHNCGGAVGTAGRQRGCDGSRFLLPEAHMHTQFGRAALSAGAVLAAAMLLVACDKSVQNADGATNTGSLGVAATTANSGTIADTGRDTGAANVDIGGAGELGVTNNSTGGSDAAANAGASGGAGGGA